MKALDILATFDTKYDETLKVCKSHMAQTANWGRSNPSQLRKDELAAYILATGNGQGIVPAATLTAFRDALDVFLNRYASRLGRDITAIADAEGRFA